MLCEEVVVLVELRARFDEANNKVRFAVYGREKFGHHFTIVAASLKTSIPLSDEIMEARAFGICFGD